MRHQRELTPVNLFSVHASDNSNVTGFPYLSPSHCLKLFSSTHIKARGSEGALAGAAVGTGL